MTKEEIIVTINDLWKSYKLDKIHHDVLKGVNLEVQKGKFVLIMGPSGSGKTTLLNIIGLIDAYDKGSYHLGSIDTTSLTPKEMRRIRLEKIGFIFQTFNLVASLTAQQNVELPLSLKKVPQDEQHTRSEELLKLVGLYHRLKNKPRQLSSGEQNRVAIARSLIIEPTIIVADEPTGNLDRKNTETIMELLTKVQKQKNVTLICTSHNIKLSEYADITYKLEDGIIKEGSY
ncbi:MAG: ABC transporter ATP-binding protein [Candidatus Lokiarchaeota archaeon]|nr:ABC transporter ATP-binding protein [Candidatus Lokiarchaeota archaeon]